MMFSARKMISSVLVAALTVSMSVVGTGCSNKNSGTGNNAASNGSTAASCQKGGRCTYGPIWKLKHQH